MMPPDGMQKTTSTSSKMRWNEIHGLKTRLSVEQAGKVKTALFNSVNIKQIVTDFISSHPSRDITNDQARDWTNIHVHVKDHEMKQVLGKIYSEGYVLGDDIAEEVLAFHVSKSVAITNKPTATTDWANWKAGNRAASALLEPPKALQKILAQRDITLAGIRGTTVDRIGVVLAKGLREGLPAREVGTSIENILSPLREKIALSLGADLSTLMSDSQRSFMIATTELSRATSMASMGRYQDSGVSEVEWLVVDPCDICQENEDSSPVPLGDDFPSGDTEPPAHPNCQCDVAPYIVDTNN